jgi:hypothetical protein
MDNICDVFDAHLSRLLACSLAPVYIKHTSKTSGSTIVPQVLYRETVYSGLLSIPVAAMKPSRYYDP